MQVSCPDVNIFIDSLVYFLNIEMPKSISCKADVGQSKLHKSLSNELKFLNGYHTKTRRKGKTSKYGKQFTCFALKTAQQNTSVTKPSHHQVAFETKSHENEARISCACGTMSAQHLRHEWSHFLLEQCNFKRYTSRKNADCCTNLTTGPKTIKIFVLANNTEQRMAIR